MADCPTNEFYKHKKWIDSATYEELLRKWRFAPSGDPLFQGQTGDYFNSVMRKRRAEVGDAYIVH